MLFLTSFVLTDVRCFLMQLVIPAFFCSWTGDALDVKTPLIRSDDALSKAATELMQLLDYKDVTHVHSTLGPEQEFFVVDRSLFTGSFFVCTMFLKCWSHRPVRLHRFSSP